ncbi:MAG: hypothetical protein EBY40_07685 [Marivivens sp.]|nr:hypothetical protein [Marivivens sp.]NBT51354.1 hypothetical protein [Marivivens sp.]NCW68883.1 hypothetical protein [Marivivens sp.]NDH02995.1 hypothetical protein [Marivivens sp.]
MTPELWLAVGGLAFTIISSTAVGVRVLSRQATSRAVDEALLADAVTKLATEIGKVAEAIEHLDGRVDSHETRISVLESK